MQRHRSRRKSTVGAPAGRHRANTRCTRQALGTRQARASWPEPLLGSAVRHAAQLADAPDQVVQLAGAALVLAAYLALQVGRARADGAGFLAMNFAGAALLAWEAGRTGQYGFLALEGVWAVASGVALVAGARRRWRPRAGSPPEPPPVGPVTRDRSSRPG